MSSKHGWLRSRRRRAVAWLCWPADGRARFRKEGFPSDSQTGSFHICRRSRGEKDEGRQRRGRRREGGCGFTLYLMPSILETRLVFDSDSVNLWFSHLISFALIKLKTAIFLVAFSYLLQFLFSIYRVLPFKRTFRCTTYGIDLINVTHST